MTLTPLKKDLVILVADQDMDFTFRGLFNRSHSLGIRPIEYDLFVHRNRDAGCYSDSHNFLRFAVNRYHYALIVFDHEGCGKEALLREDIEAEVEHRLHISGWENRAVVVAIHPELEIWVWSTSPHVDAILGWAGRQPPLRSWLQQKNHIQEGQVKPERPKEVMHEALRQSTKRPSASLFKQIAEQVSFDRCIDPSFLKLKLTLQGWFQPLEIKES